MNDESIKEAQQLCKDLELLCSEDITLLEYIIDEYVYLLDDNRKAQLRKLVDQELEHDYA
tara:strand:- start:203 stop:382 length:180 start_codon:yes stop_codon:yes gene_type:complete